MTKIRLTEGQLKQMIKESISERGKWVHGLYPDNADAVDRTMLRHMVDIERKYGEEMFGQAVRKLYEAGKIEIPNEIYEQLKDLDDDRFGLRIDLSMRNGKFFLSLEDMELIEKYCERPYFWEEEEEGEEAANQIGLSESRRDRNIRLTEGQLKNIIREVIGKVLDEPVETDYGEFADVMEFLTPFFDKWGWKYRTELENHGTANCLLIRFKHKLGASSCARLCAEINSHLEWSKFSNYKCLWGVNEKTRTFSFELWEKHYDDEGNRIK